MKLKIKFEGNLTTVDRSSQCDQIGRILKVLGHKFLYNSCPIKYWLFGSLWKTKLSKLNWCRYYLGNVCKIWATFNCSIRSHCIQICKSFSFISIQCTLEMTDYIWFGLAREHFPKGKYHCTAGLQFNRIWLNQKRK